LQLDYIFYAVPPILAISLVYAATRHEDLRLILFHAGRVAAWIVGFMVLAAVLILLIGWYL